MADNTGKTWMSIGETDDPNAIIETFEAATAITKGDPVYLSADDKVSPASSAQDCIGIAVKTVASGQPCPVLVRGRIKVKVGGAITRGKAVYGGDASKRILQLTDQAVNEGGTSTYTIYYNRKLGTALESASAADDLIFIVVEK
ncbi:MAG: DUF2190 family protein [Candidatus Bathyarchaeota archaeon]|jgi:hypothetical protein|nr:DUF2190 family protein [Candidatus Bathyarchaeota archaeon A05DMB-5]MDH7558390.1 DUF2190 family protein [Candidatus Bathyarchaeota archaeon]